jgi:hypothetical protein
MRPEGKRQVNIAVDREAAELIKAWATSRRGQGDVVTRLVFEERARQEERERLRRAPETVVGAGNTA